jgi:hypothetical protein
MAQYTGSNQTSLTKPCRNTREHNSIERRAMQFPHELSEQSKNIVLTVTHESHPVEGIQLLKIHKL